MWVDLIQRIYSQRSKGNPEPFNQFNSWLNKNLGAPGPTVKAGGKLYTWKIVSAIDLNHIINDDDTDWMLIQSEDFAFQSLSKIYYRESNLLNKKDMPLLLSLWLIKCDFEGLLIDEDPIQIARPYTFSSPIHRLNPDVIKLIERLKDKNTEIIRYVDYKTFKKDMIKIR